jgi:hypothetical protein
MLSQLLLSLLLQLGFVLTFVVTLFLPLPLRWFCPCPWFSVIPADDLLLFVILTTFFYKNSPKIACQAPEPPNSHKQNGIELAL